MVQGRIRDRPMDGSAVFSLLKGRNLSEYRAF